MHERRIGSLFSGIGGLELGLERAGLGRVVWQVEKDAFRRRVLERRFGDVQRWTDVRDVGTHNLEPVEVLCGGFPCQPWSQAGDRRGVEDPRWLWPEFARLVRELRPEVVVLENVSQLRRGGLQLVLADMAALGYDAEWQSLHHAAVGGPTGRQRLFLVAYPNGERQQERGEHDGSPVAGEEGQQRDDADGLRSPVPHGRRPAVERPRVFSEGAQRALADLPGRNRQHLGPWEAEPSVGRMDPGLADGVDRLSALGDSVSPVVAEFIGRCIVSFLEESESALGLTAPALPHGSAKAVFRAVDEAEPIGILGGAK